MDQNDYLQQHIKDPLEVRRSKSRKQQRTLLQFTVAVVTRGVVGRPARTCGCAEHKMVDEGADAAESPVYA